MNKYRDITIYNMNNIIEHVKRYNNIQYKLYK